MGKRHRDLRQQGDGTGNGNSGEDRAVERPAAEGTCEDGAAGRLARRRVHAAGAAGRAR